MKNVVKLQHDDFPSGLEAALDDFYSVHTTVHVAWSPPSLRNNNAADEADNNEGDNNGGNTNEGDTSSH